MPNRFPENGIFAVVGDHPTHDLAGSTSRDLTLGELLALADPSALAGLDLGYGSSAGSEPLRQILAADLGVPPEAVVTTTGGASLALAAIALEAVAPGDRVVVARPSFPAAFETLVAAGLDVVPLPLAFESGYALDLDRLADTLTPATRLVSLATPQNPSGVAIPLPTIRDALDVLDRHAPRALLLVDETYREAVYGNAPVPPSAAALDPRILTVASISKAHGAPGLRVGWLTAHDPALRARLVLAKNNLVITGSVLDEALAAVLLQHREAILAPRRAHLAQALDTVEAWVGDHADRLAWNRPDGGALCAVRLRPEVYGDVAVDAFWDALPALDLRLADGSWFGESRRVARLGFGHLPLDRLRLALDAVSAALQAPLDGRGSLPRS